MIKWRQQYTDPKRDEQLAILSGIDSSILPDLTIQSGKEDADINTLMRRFAVTGQIPTKEMTPFYGDFSAAHTYHESLTLIREAETAFQDLPSRIRNRFNNNPAELIEFLEDPANRREAEELGLVTKAVPDAAQIPLIQTPDPLDQKGDTE